MYYNFAFIETEQINYSILIDFCKYDYTFFVDRPMKTIMPDILNKEQLKKDEYDIERNNNEVVKVLLSNHNIDVNIIYKEMGKQYFFDNLTMLLFVAFLVSLKLPHFSSLFIRFK